MKLFAGAQHWLAAHHTQALAGGAAGVVGFALYKRHQNGGSLSAPTVTPATGDFAAGDPGSVGTSSTLSDVDAALLDADLTGIAGTLDSIKTTLANLPRPGKAKSGGKAKKPKAKKPKKSPAKKRRSWRPGLGTYRPGPARSSGHQSHSRVHKAPVTRAEQKRRHDTAARAHMTALPTTHAAAGANRRVVNNPRPVNNTRVPTPAAAPVAQRRTLARPSPKPAPTVKRRR